MVPHPAAVPATTRSHRRCMGMSSDHPRDLNLTKGTGRRITGPFEQPRRHRHSLMRGPSPSAGRTRPG